MLQTFLIFLRWLNYNNILAVLFVFYIYAHSPPYVPFRYIGGVGMLCY